MVFLVKVETAIFEAIKFSLFGTGKKLVSHDEKKMSVSLKFYTFDNDKNKNVHLKITRSKGPGRLLLVNSNGEFEDDVAQGIINEMFGENFCITSYITEDYDQTFLKLSASEKMNFLEQQAFGVNGNIEELKKLTKDELKSKKNEVQKATSTLEVIQSELNSIKDPDYVSFPLKGTIDQQSIKIIEFNKSLEETKSEIITKEKTLNKQIREFDLLELEDKRYKQLEKDKLKYEDEKSNIDEKIENLDYDPNIKEKIKELKDKLNFLKTKEDYNLKKSKYIEDVNYLKKLKEKEVESFNKQKEEYKEEYKKIKEELETIKLENIENLEIQIDLVKNKISNYRENEKKKDEYNKLLSPFKYIDQILQLIDEKKRERKIENNTIDNKKTIKDLYSFKNDKQIKRENVKENKNILNNKIIKIKNDMKTRKIKFVCPGCQLPLSICNDMIIKSTIKEVSGEEKKELEDLENELNHINILINNIEKDIKDTELKIKNIEKDIEEKEKENRKIQKENEKINLEIGKLQHKHDTLFFLKENLKEISIDINELTKQLEIYNQIIFENKKKENNINDLNKNLSILSNKIDRKLEFSKTLKDINDKLIKNKSDIKKFEDENDFGEENEGEESNNNKENNNIDQIREQLDLLNKNESNYQLLEKQLLFIKDKIKELNKDISVIIEKLKDKENIKDEIETLKKEINDQKEKVKKLNKIEKELIKYNEYKKLKDNYDKWQTKYDNAKLLEEKETKELALINKYWAKILESESIAVNSTIRTINYNVNKYLETFFEDNSINVSLTTFKETKKAIKPGINLNVFYKGKDYDFSSLSKGEKSRVNLAFLLALHNLTNSKLILLDECIGSLDAQLCDDILEILKEQNKMILVIAHQVNTGMFSEIINF